MALRLCPSLRHQFVPPFHSKTPVRTRKLFVRSCIVDPNESRKWQNWSKKKEKRGTEKMKLGFLFLNSMGFGSNMKSSIELVMDVKEKLERDHHNLPVGKNGRDDEAMILWYLKDRKFSVEEAVSKLVKAIKWRQEFGVSELSEESVRNVAETGKAYVHDFLDVYDRPVLIVVASKHFPGKHNPYENEKLCVFSIEKALSRLPPAKEEILVILDLRGFGTENADLRFTTFLFDVFYCYYPKRLGQVLFVEAPFVFKPVWELAKPLLKSYASLVRFCTVEDVKSEYFTESTLPNIFRH